MSPAREGKRNESCSGGRLGRKMDISWIIEGAVVDQSFLDFELVDLFGQGLVL